jgi:glutathione S-transferase
MPLLDRTAPDASKSHTLQKGESRLAYLDRYLAGRDYLLDRFSVADAYLFTVLNWSAATAVDLARWPAINDYYTRLRQRPSIAKALAEEHALYAAQRARHKVA